MKRKKEHSKSTLTGLLESAERVKEICRTSHDLVVSCLKTYVGANNDLREMTGGMVIFRTTRWVAATCPGCEADVVVFSSGVSVCGPVLVQCVECERKFELADPDTSVADDDHESDPGLN